MENNLKKVQTWFLHIDLDAFFASVEQLDNPEYRGKPVIVGGRKEDKRGVVSTASYEARKFGVHSAMPLFQAIRLCPEGIFLRGRMDRYAELSFQIMNIFREFSPDVDQMSIDEAFIDLTGTEQLFGPPEETAMKVKKRVKDLTGLTVSVGLATTKYLAKIASGYSKPNGFYFIKPGKEQDFMLNLPLKKVWGIGPKALERLKKSGINTTQDIYEKPKDLLTFLYGSTMGNFLYNVVRGEEKESFTRKKKSHSISAEETFSCDITDVYTAETALLELAQGVMFRLLKEEKYSRTVTVKIKYDDFTSVSIQKTLDRNIMTLDTFFDNIKVLFEQKYEKGRGIRLLGVGFDKVETEDKPYQQSLFENKEDKKQAVEKAILGLNKKHPEIKIKKARLLKSIAFLFIFISQLISIQIKNANLWAQDNTVSVKGSGTLLPNNNENLKKDPSDNGVIFNWDINDKNKVEFDISGHWQADITGSFLSSFGNGTPFKFVPNIPVFKQDVELSSLFTLNKKWYFEANFADNFSNNTLAMGYNGDGYFRSGRLSNRNITMPNTYSAEHFGFGLSGGKNQAPGFSGHWQSPTDKWSGDLLVRYDMTMPKSAVFYGMNKVNDKIINTENYLYGYSFYFPEKSSNNLLNIKDIYVENEHGTYKDIYGNKYYKLSASDYYYSTSNNILYISPNARGNKQDGKIPTILVTFLSSSVDKIITDCGNYNEENSFKGKIQKLFNKSNKNINLDEYSYKLKSNIENQDALVIQNSVGFSPFILPNTYDCGTNENIDISVISKGSNETLDQYIAEIQNNSYTAPYEDFFNLQHSYAKVKKSDGSEIPYPFVETNPEIYLNLKSDSHIGLLLRSYNNVSEINIGQKASAGTIQVFRNGVNDQDFIYNINTGSISLGSPVKNTDQIRILWQEEASNYAKGALSIGAGFNLNILPELNWDIALTAQKPINFEEVIYTQETIQSSFVALSTGINYSKNGFTIEDKAAFSVQKQNDCDKLLVSSQKNNTPNQFPLNYDSGYVTTQSPSLNGTKLSQNNNFTIKNHQGKEDRYLKGYKIPLTWDFSTMTSNGEKAWAAVNIAMTRGNLLKDSSKLNFLIKPEQSLESYDIYLQLGIKADSSVEDEINYIPTYNITDKINKTSTDWQNIEIEITQKDRSYLVNNSDARFIIIPKNNSAETGTIFIGSYTPSIQSIYALSDEDVFLHTTSIPSGDDYYSSVINWTIPESDKNNHIITATSHFTPADFSIYKTINLKFAYQAKSSKEITPNESEKKESLIITLDTNSDSPLTSGKKALELKIKDISDYISSTTNYHIISININDKSVKIDGTNIKDYTITLDDDVAPSRVKYEISSIVGNKQNYNSSFYVDNIIFEESDINIAGHNYLKTAYKKADILKINDFVLLENGFIETDSNQKFTKDDVTVLSTLNTGITIADISLQTDFSIKQDEFQNVGHSIKSVSPIVNIFLFDEKYRWNKQENSMQKDNTFNIDFSTLKLPLVLSSTLTAQDSNFSRSQSHNTEIKTNFNINDYSFDFSSSLFTNQKINLIKNNDDLIEKNNYFKNWYDITSIEFSTGYSNASIRETKFNNKLNFGIKNDLVSPSLEYNLSSSYEDISKTSFSDKTTINLLLPITLKNNFISFGLYKNGGDITSTSSGGNYFTDLGDLFTLQSQRNWIYTSIPFYELFDQNMEDKVSGTYSTKYEIVYKKKLFNSFKDLYIPSSASLSVIRDIQSREKYSDIYQIKAVITNTSLNNFGKNSKNHIFDWFNQEEIISSLTGIVKIPTDKPENTTYQLSAYLQMLFMITDKSILNTAFDFTFETNLNWSTSGTLVYTRPGKSCLMSAIADLFIDENKQPKFDINRKDSFIYKIGTTNKINRQEYTYNHSVDMTFLEYFTVSTGIGGTFTYLENNASSLGINYTIGGKIKF